MPTSRGTRATRGAAPYKVVWKLPGARNERSRSFTRKDAANAFLREREDEVEGRAKPRDAEAGGITLRDHALDAMASWVDVRDETIERYRIAVEAQILPTLGDLALDAIDRAVLQTWIRDLGRNGNVRTGGALSASSIHKAIYTLTRLLDDAVPTRLPANPLRVERANLRIPQIEAGSRDSLTPREIEKLAGETPDEYRALVWVGATAGLRIGELLAIRWRDVDLDAATVRVVRSVTESGGIIRERNYGKTSSAFRTVSIPPVTVDALRELHGWTDPTSAALVFAAARGGVYRPSLFRARVFGPAARAAGLDGITPHVLRHTCATLWLTAGATPMEVARWMGHSPRDGGAFVVRRYGHVLDAHRPAVIDALASLLDS